MFEERKQVFLRIMHNALKIRQNFGGCLITGPHSQIRVPRCILAMHLQVKNATGVSRDHYLSITSAGQRRLGKNGKPLIILTNCNNGDSLVFSQCVVFLEVVYVGICWCDYENA